MLRAAATALSTLSVSQCLDPGWRSTAVAAAIHLTATFLPSPGEQVRLRYVSYASGDGLNARIGGSGIPDCGGSMPGAVVPRGPIDPSRTVLRPAFLAA